MNCVTSERSTDVSPTLTASRTLSLSQKPYDYSVYTDYATVADKGVNLRPNVQENAGISGHKCLSFINKPELFPETNKIKTYDVCKYKETDFKTPNDKETEKSSEMQCTSISKQDVSESGSLVNVEERTRMVREIQSELVKWRQKQRNAQAVQYDGKICATIIRGGKVDCEQSHQNIAVSSSLTGISSKLDLHGKPEAIPNTNNGNSLGSQCK
jgi:hypothetical protein